MTDAMRLPALLGALLGVLLAVLGMVAFSPLLLERVTVSSVEEGPVRVALRLSPLFLTVSAVGTSAVFGAVTAYVARSAMSVLRPELEVRARPEATALLGAVVGAVLGTIAAFLAVGVLGQETEAGLLVPFFPSLLLLALGGAIFGAGTAVSVYAFSEPALEGEEAEEIRVVRRRLIGAIGLPVAAVLGMAVLVLGLAYLFLSFHSWAPVLGVVVAGGILGFAGLIAARPRRRIPVTEVLLAVAAVAIVVAAIVLAVGPGDEHHGEEAPPAAELDADQPSDTSEATSEPPSDS